MNKRTNFEITIEGRQYRSVDEVPPEILEKYPEVLQAARDLEAGAFDKFKPGKVTAETFVYEGRTYHSREELPQEVREALAQTTLPDVAREKPEAVIEATKTLSEFVIGPYNVKRDGSESRKAARWLIAVLLLLVLAFLVLRIMGVELSELIPGN